MLLKRLSIVLAIGLAVALGARLWAPLQAMPDVSFTTLDHGIVPTQALAGQVVLVNFWATSCAVCMQEMRRIAELHRRYAARGYDTVAVAMPYDPPNLVLAYQREARLPFKVAIDPRGEVTRRFDDVKLTPTTYLIDRRGRVLKRYLGAPDFAEVERLIERALAG